jgi:hypothetical protein
LSVGVERQPSPGDQIVVVVVAATAVAAVAIPPAKK